MPQTHSSEMFLTTPDLFEEYSNSCLQFWASLVVFYCTLLGKEFYLYYLLLFFLNNYFRWVFSTLSFNFMSFKMFPSYPFSMSFYFSIAYFFYVWLEWNRWFWSSILGYTVCFLMWLWMTWMFMQIPVHWVFGRELSKSVALVFTYQWVQKLYVFDWNIVFKFECFMFAT